MLILVINCGSSSAKYKLYDIKKDIFLAEGSVEKIGEAVSSHKHKYGKGSIDRKVKAADHHEAMSLILGILTEDKYRVIDSAEEIGAIGHRVVHGGEEFNKSVIIDNNVIASITKFSKLAPLHNPPALAGIKACKKLLPAKTQVAVFDTAFHQTMPKHAFMYGLPERHYTKYHIRKYGFHGTSHKYVAGKAAKILKKPLNHLKIITCHLGNGCSMAAVLNGRSVDTSMGFTPLEGLVMGTRCGDLDPAILTFLQEKENLSPRAVNSLLNKKSGLLGLSGVSNDMRELREAASSGDRRAGAAIEVFYYRIKKYIGSYIAAMNGVDVIVLTAGIGENNPWLKSRLEKDLSGVLKGLGARILVVPTKEEWMIAAETYKLLKGGHKHA
ncbi:MAG: acetate kinase [Candidatus Omnitrophota bacterium]